MQTNTYEPADFVTVSVGGQLFGIPVSVIQDVFSPAAVTRVPLARPEVSGVLNLRGRIVTAIDLRCRFSIADEERPERPMAIGIEKAGEVYGLMVDEVGEVLRLEAGDIDPNPVNLDDRWARFSAGIHRLDGRLMVVLDVDRLLSFGSLEDAA
ncbi:MAG: chemotaxis protein CheW [Alphaproteobacteria bacterium]|nr:chemotaxis protein CheW [Alphaproteobacteria bacterium]